MLLHARTHARKTHPKRNTMHTSPPPPPAVVMETNGFARMTFCHQPNFLIEKIEDGKKNGHAISRRVRRDASVPPNFKETSRGVEFGVEVENHNFEIQY